MGDQAGSPGQIIALPKGGGAQGGLGEKFTPDLHTGTGNFTIPLAVPPGRNGFQPQLSLLYSTGNRNGAFGLGWTLSLPGVTRKTSSGIPRYRDEDRDSARRDVFVLSGMEDLVPVAHPSLPPDTSRRYRPRTEGLFAEIIHHHDPVARTNYWEVATRDGLVSRYGDSPAAIIAAPGIGPGTRERIFAWLLTQTLDAFGNRIEYLYESGSGPDQPQLHQIRYGDFQDGMAKFLVTVTFNYESRPDAFSDYRAGFEIRTSRRCSFVLIETHAGQTRPVREYRFSYENDRHNGVSLLKKIDVIGFDDAGHRYDGQTQDGELRERQLPPLEFAYTTFEPEKRRFEPVQGDVPPLSLGRKDMELVDLHGAGLPDILELSDPVRYWRNRGERQFDSARTLREAPVGSALAAGGVTLLDADGDGRTDLMVGGAPLAGYFPLEFPANFSRRSFHKYDHGPSFDLEDPEVRLIDLTGDGVNDALRTGARIECFFNDPKSGWSGENVRRIERRALSVFPDVSFSDARVRVADMSGDGMQDIVLIHDRSVEYWPNLGHGNWGGRVHMTSSPSLPYGYDPKRLLLADVDGDGLADLVYVDQGKVHLWINRSGTAWSEPIVVRGTPSLTNVDGLRIADLLGSGTGGVLWSTDVGRPGPRNFMFLDFTGGTRPYLLCEMNNHLGAVTRVEYRSSSHFFLEDARQRATRWRTPLPFPVQVVAKVVVIDALSRGRLTTEYRYHHGYWDGLEHEFRGFGRVDQFDSESIGEGANFSPPTLTKTWFHLGPVGPAYALSSEDLDWSTEFWPGDSPLLDHSELVTPFLLQLARSELDRGRSRRDAVRALRGKVIRTELYAIDGSESQRRPYSVSEYQYGLREVDAPRVGERDRRRIYFPQLRGQRTTQWERGSDPLTTFAFTDAYDDFGQSCRMMSIACPRGWRRMTDRPADEYLATCTSTTYASPVANGPYIRDRVAVSTTYQFINTAALRVTELRNVPDDSGLLRVIGQTLNYYDGLAFVGLSGADFAKVGRHGALSRSEQLVFTAAHIVDALRDTGVALPPWLNPQGANWTAEYPASFRARAPALGGYVYSDGSDGRHASGYFASTVRRAYDFQTGATARGMVMTHRDALGHDTALRYDAFDLLPSIIMNPAGLETRVLGNYRCLQLERLTDANGNITRVEYSPLGLPTKTWTRGKRPEEGDSVQPGVELTYDLLAFERRAEPVSVRTSRRERHDTDAEDNGATLETVEYSDGLGRLLQTRTQAADTLYGDERFGLDLVPADVNTRPAPMQGRTRDGNGASNVVVTGWQIYDNKGRVVQRYEPFFARGWSFETPERDEFGRKVTLFYDPRGQLVRSVNADGSEHRVIYGWPRAIDDPPEDGGDTVRFIPSPWEAYTYDGNDNAGRTHAATAGSYSHHWNTPASIVIDALGRTLRSVQRNRDGPGAALEEHVTATTHDIYGNVMTIVDALERTAFRHVFDFARRRLRIDSIDAGTRLSFFDADGNLVEARDRKGAITLHAYDVANRPSHLWARDDANGPTTLRERIEYGDERPDQADAANRNQRGRVWRHRDEAGEILFERYDFKGNVAEKARRVITPDALADPAFRVDWESANAPALDETSYRIGTRFDALSRIVSVKHPQDVDGGRRELVATYNRAGALESVRLDDQQFVERIAYNARGQRAFVAYGNGILTAFDYDRDTFRLRRIWTGRATHPGGDTESYEPSGAPLQNLAYAYDLMGNVTNIVEAVPGCGVRKNVDAANDRYANLRVALIAGDALVREFEYDALYRLKRATGREASNIASAGPWAGGFRPDGFNWGTQGIPNPGNARDFTRRYVETYTYDPAGNMNRLWHDAGGVQWARAFGMSGFMPEVWRTRILDWLAGGMPDLGSAGNRLTNFGTATQSETHRFDACGNLIREFTNRLFEWDHDQRLRLFREQDAAGGTRTEARYLYDSSGRRVMKRARVGSSVAVTIYIEGLFEHHVVDDEQNDVIHVLDGKDRIALVRIQAPLQDDAGPAVQYHLGDHVGSSVVVVGGADSAANMLRNREEFMPHGETSFGSFARKRYRYSGKERDEESGLSYYGARYYPCWLMRWITPDPVGYVSDPNLYTFAKSAPVAWVDRTGLQETPAPAPAPQQRSPMTIVIAVGKDAPEGDRHRMNNELAFAHKVDVLLNRPTSERVDLMLQRGDNVVVLIPPRVDAKIVQALQGYGARLQRMGVNYSVEAVKTADFAGKMNSLRDIERLYYFGHGDTTGLLFNYPERLSGFKNLSSESFSGSALAVFASCNSSVMATEFVEKVGVMADGTTDKVYYSWETIGEAFEKKVTDAGTILTPRESERARFVRNTNPGVETPVVPQSYTPLNPRLDGGRPFLQLRRDPFQPSTGR